MENMTKSLQVTAEIARDPCTFQVGSFILGDIDKFKFGKKPIECKDLSEIPTMRRLIKIEFTNPQTHPRLMIIR